MRILKYITVIFLLSFWSCSQPLSNDQNVDEAESSGASLEARFYIPDWDAPKDGSPVDSRVLDPNSYKVILYDNFGNNWIDEVIINFDSELDLDNPDRLGEAFFSGLEARTYLQGELEIEVATLNDDVLTSGENLGDVTLSAQTHSSIEFSSVPITTGTANIGTNMTLTSGQHTYVALSVAGAYVYELSVTRTSAIGDLDVYVFDEIGRLVNSDYSVEEQDEEMLIHFAPEGSGLYYVTFKSYVDDLTFNYSASYSSTLDRAISGMLTFPPATGGDKVYFKHNGVHVLTKEVGRNGDTSMNYVIPGLSDGDSGTLWINIDRDGSSEYIDPNTSLLVIDVHSNSGDFNGYLGSVSVNGSHISGVNLELEENKRLSGTLTVSPAMPTGTTRVMVLLDENGFPHGSFTPSTVSDPNDSNNLSYEESTINYSFIPEVGQNRVLIIYDVDNSGVGNIGNFDDVDEYLTDGDHYFMSDLITVNNSSVSGVNGATSVAAIIEGTITMPEFRTAGNYVVFSDYDTDYTNGIKSGDYFYISDFSGTDTFTYRLVVPENESLYIGALVDGSGSALELTSGDLFGYLNESSSATYVNTDLNVVDFSITSFDVGLSGTVTLPAGVNADGKNYMVGVLNNDLWTTPDYVPVNTGIGGSFNYNLGGIQLTEGNEVVVVIDMDNNGLENSPNAGDIIGFLDGVSFTNSDGEVLDFPNTEIAGPMVSGQVLSIDTILSKNYAIELDGEIVQYDTMNGTSADYQLMFLDPGEYLIRILVDQSNDGEYGNFGDYVGETNVTVSTLDVVATNIDILMVEHSIKGEVELPFYLSGITKFIVTLSNEDVNAPSYSFEVVIDPLDNTTYDIVAYSFFDVVPGDYKLSLLTDFDNDGLLSSGEYQGFYPYGGIIDSSEVISIDSDINNLNFVVDGSSQI